MSHHQSPKKASAAPQPQKPMAQLPSPDVNNAKENITLQSITSLKAIANDKPASRKPRSKSIGPGGLDALREDAGNRRQSALPPSVKSILKTTIPLSPPRRIPPHASSQRASPSKTHNAALWKNSNPISGSNNLPNPFQIPTSMTNSTSNLLSPSESETRVAVRSEAEQQAAAKERGRQEALAHKDARRKSLANRRVSFAPEATLHTWDVVELPEDSTTSSTSPNSTRRASASSTVAASPYPQPRSPMTCSDVLEPPSTPPEKGEQIQVADSPVPQRELHQKKYRRSSGIPPMNFNNLDDFSSSPDSDNSDCAGRQNFLTPEKDGESSNSDDDSVEDESTVTGINVDDVTAQSNGASSTGSSGKLDEALRQAAAQAGTQGIEYDENGDITMEMADDEVTAAFQPWMNSGNSVLPIMPDPLTLQDKENVDPFSEAFKTNVLENIPFDDAEKTMDFTHAVGAILVQHQEEPHASPISKPQKAVNGGRRRSSGANRRSLDDGSVFGDETMDLTTAIGGIQQKEPAVEQTGRVTNSGPVDVFVEVTNEPSSILEADEGPREDIQVSPISHRVKSSSKGRRRSSVARRRSSGDGSVFDDVTMDFTTAVGGIQKNKPLFEPNTTTPTLHEESINGDEELTMELTSVVEAAKSLIVKRSLELDEHDEESLPRRVKGREGSPTKKAQGSASLSRALKQNSSDSANVDEVDRTMELTHAIGSILPSREEPYTSAKYNRRKSAILGAAKGLLGRRPAELDEDDEESTPRSLKGKERSPIKQIRLPAPPTKTETTGRVNRSGSLALTDSPKTPKKDASTPSKGSPLKRSGKITPINRPRFKGVESSPSPNKPLTSFNQRLVAGIEPLVTPPVEYDHIRLQDFLNMTSIRFMELTTTKRRLTVAPGGRLESDPKSPASGSGFSSSAEKASEFESSVIAGACTIPMLELYQHSCRELKNYIAEGRSIVREIEAETFEDNPPLFREYISAHPEDKAAMDNQFKNVKTHARLLSKAMWYQWRMKLLAGLREDLLKIDEGLDDDEKRLTQQENILDLTLPGVIEEHDKLEAERQLLQFQADEIANCDQGELHEARNNLEKTEKELQSKRKMFEELQDELRRKEDSFENAVERKQQCMAEIKEAEKIREDYRGWSPSEVAALQGRVDGLEKAHGWTISSITGASLTMTYKRTIQLFFAPSSFSSASPLQPPKSKAAFKAENSPISLTYIADAAKYHSIPLTTEKRFFLQIMRAQLQCLAQAQTRIKDLLSMVSSNWEKCTTIADEVRSLTRHYITEPTIQSDEAMSVKVTFLLRDMKTKVELAFGVEVVPREMDLNVAVKVGAKVIYGETLKEGKMVEFLEERIAEEGDWAKAVRELEGRLVRRGKKA